MSSFVIPPSLFLIAGAALLPFLGARLRLAALLGLPVLSLLAIWQLPDGVAMSGQFLGFELAPVKVDALSRVSLTRESSRILSGLWRLRRRVTTLRLD